MGEWTQDCQDAFEVVKTSLVKVTILHLVKPNSVLVLSTDCFKHAIGAVLEQIIDGHLYPVAYCSRSLKPAEKNYMNYEREELALVDSVKHF
jgi:hypothetical protein